MKLMEIAFILILMFSMSACGGSNSSNSSSTNLPPIAILTAPEIINTSNSILLDGSSSNDPDGQTLIYSWLLISAPPNSLASLATATDSKTFLTPDFDGDYVVRLTVTDSYGLSGSTTLNLSSKSDVNVGPNINSFGATLLDINAGTSVDFSWNIIDINNDSINCTFDPMGNGEAIQDCPNSNSNTHTYDIPGSYYPTLSISDGELTSTKNLKLIVRGDPLIKLLDPIENQIFDKTIQIAANVTSIYEFEIVTARIANNLIELSLLDNPICEQGGLCTSTFNGKMNVPNLPGGAHILEIIAKDIQGKESRFYQKIIHDKSPTIVENSTLDNSVATPLLPLSVSCMDGEGQCTLRIYNNDSMQADYASGVGNINTVINLRHWEPRITLAIEANDSRGQITKNLRWIYVEESAKLTPVKTVDGYILDVSNNKIAYRSINTGVLDYYRTEYLHIYDLTNDTVNGITLPTEQPRYISEAYINDFGALITTQTPYASSARKSRFFEWNSHQLNEYANQFSASRNYIVWEEQGQLIRKHLNNAMMTTINTNGADNSNVADDGLVVWEGQGDQIYSYTDTPTQITNNNLFRHSKPVTDGKIVVYYKSEICCGSKTITLFDGTNEINLGIVDKNLQVPRAQDYQIRDGWVSYTNIGSSAQKHVWSYDPSGNRVQRTFFQASSYIETMGDNGELMLISGKRRYLSTADGTLTEISSDSGKSYFVEGKWYIAIGRVLFTIVNEEP